ncbi:S53 family peptidase [Ktedonosporobacter rubrisoli]|nr:S53 family peptidase [Ktedonosporobacter rubrisoli]
MSFLAGVRQARSHSILVNLLCLLILCVPLVSCWPFPDAPQFTSVNLGIPGAALNSPVVGQLPNDKVLHMRITFKVDQNWLKKLEQHKVQQGQPSRLEKFANNLGVSDTFYQKVKNFFSLSGITLQLSKLHTHLSVDAKVSTLSRLLQTKFVLHNYNGRTFYAPNPAPKVPTFLANSIEAITGLDNYSGKPVHDLMLHFAATRTHKTAQQADCYPSANTLFPRDIAGAYGQSQLWQRGLNGENMTINLVEVDGSYREDIQNYLSCINFRGHVSIANVDNPPADALGESTLDIQMVAGLARAANIVVYQTDGNSSDDVWGSVNDELQQLINDNVNNANSGGVVSISLGIAEAEMTADDLRAIDSSLEQLTRIEHMTVFVASGDCGAFGDEHYGHLAVSFPASDPWVTSVGGTFLQVDRRQERSNESAWSDGSNHRSCKNRWGSGGGNSELFKLPGWQNAPGVRNSFSHGARQIPDLAAAAYNLAVYFNGQWGAVGGTSAAAPIWAAGLALVNEGTLKQNHTFAYGPQLFYQVMNSSGGARAYYDVTRGNNLYYPATAGWDFTTGLGTPNLPAFYQTMESLL